jgi:hypothetical protein
MDSQFQFLGYRFGLDPILGLFPGFGDTVSLILALYLIYIATEMNMPRKKLVLMVRNMGIDFVLGILPVVGDVSDFIYKSNQKNLEILEAHIREVGEEGEIVS